VAVKGLTKGVPSPFAYGGVLKRGGGRKKKKKEKKGI